MTVLALLPLFVFGLVAAAFRCGRPGEGRLLREDLLRAALVVGVGIGLGTEVLGALHAIAFAGVLVFWLGAVAASGATLAWRWSRRGPPEPIRIPKLGASETLMIGGVAAVALGTLVVAWFSPPQSPDSISYHMGRVMHWIQNHSLAPYPTYDSRQLFDPPLAEMVRLHLQLLTGADRAGCLLQWLAAMAALAATSLVARDLGGGRRAQIFAAVFAATLPIGVTQATSGKTDWVEALWLLALVHFGCSAAGRRPDPPRRGDMVLVGAALGLAIATKLTAWVFAPAFLAIAIAGIPRANFRRLLAPAAAGILLAAALIAPFLCRNISVYGNAVSDPVFEAGNGIANVTPAIVVSNALRDAIFQFRTPSRTANRVLESLVNVVHRIIGVDSSDPRTTLGRFQIRTPGTVEESAGSPLQILLLAGVGVALLGRRGQRQAGPRRRYLAALGTGYLLFCATVRWSPPTCRLLLPLLALAAPLVSAVAADLFGGRGLSVLAIILFVGCGRFVVNTHARPLSFEPGRGILATPRIDLYFARVPELHETYLEVARVVRSTGAHNLGVVVTDGIAYDYLLSVLLADVNPPVRIEDVAVANASEMLESRKPFQGFHPEMIVAFDGNLSHPRFAREIVAGETRYQFLRASGSAGFYLPQR